MEEEEAELRPGFSQKQLFIECRQTEHQTKEVMGNFRRPWSDRKLQTDAGEMVAGQSVLA